MRVISGKFGGRHLVSFKASHLRPTSDRVKESLFNMLRDRVEDARVLDLFGGTGSLAIEAISRGAMSVHSVEKNPKSLDIIRRNMELLGLKKEILVQKMDVFRFLKSYSGDPFDLILADPPFTEKIAHSVMEAIAASSTWGNSTLIAIESAGKERIDPLYGELHQVDSRDFSDKILSFFERKVQV